MSVVITMELSVKIIFFTCFYLATHNNKKRVLMENKITICIQMSYPRHQDVIQQLQD